MTPTATQPQRKLRFAGAARERCARAAARRAPRAGRSRCRCSSGCWPPGPAPRWSRRSASPRWSLAASTSARPTSRSRSSPRSRRQRAAAGQRRRGGRLRPRHRRADRGLPGGHRGAAGRAGAAAARLRQAARRRRRARPGARVGVAARAPRGLTGRRRGALRRDPARRADRRRGDRRVHPPAGADARSCSRSRGSASGARVSYAGETALAQETVDSLAGDLRRVALVTAVAMFILLAIFLRALLAPLLLLFGSLLACAAAFGITALLVPERRPRLLRAAGRRRDAGRAGVGLQRADRRPDPRGDAPAPASGRRSRSPTPAASRAITVAGITLAATFALLALVPLRPFKELALLMALGVLIDALFVRPLLIPALIALAGRARGGRAACAPPSLDTPSVRARPDARSRSNALTLGERMPAARGGGAGPPRCR